MTNVNVINIFEGLVDNNQPALYEKAISNGTLTKAVRVFAKGLDSQGNVSGYRVLTIEQTTGRRKIYTHEATSSVDVVFICNDFFNDVDFKS